MDNKQQQVYKQTTSDSSVQEAENKAQEQVSVKAMDDILDEIDAVLEENAESFVQDFVQKGGQ